MSDRKEGWFTTPGRPGDRTLEEQMAGLGPLWPRVYGGTVLDVGCAEGLISMEAIRRGARYVRGVEIVPGHVHIARRMAESLPRGSITFQVGDANTYVPPCASYDVVLLLAILHKLRDPVAACKRYAAAATTLCVIRLPPDGAPIIRDVRTKFQPFDIGAAMEQEGWKLVEVCRGHDNEWTGYYERVKDVA